MGAWPPAPFPGWSGTKSKPPLRNCSPDEIAMKSMKSIALGAALLSGLASCTTSQTHPGTEGDGDFTIGPDYTNAPELTARSGVPAGTVHEFTMNSADSKTYPGIKPVTNAAYLRRDSSGNRMALPAVDGTAGAPYTRRVWVYVPSQYVPGTPAPFIVVQD